MKILKLSAITLAAFAATGAQAATFTEGFDEPFAGWESRWFGTQSNAYNYYVSEPGGGDPSYRGASDVTGMWLSDGDSYLDGGDYGQIHIRFDKAFGASLASFSMDIASALPNAEIVFYDMDGMQIGAFVVPASPTSAYWTPVGYNNVSVTSANGIGGFSFTGFAQGNVIVDNLVATQAAVPEPSSWAMMLLGTAAIGAALRKRKQAVAVRFA